MENDFVFLNNKEHRFIPYMIMALTNLCSYAGVSYENLVISEKQITMKSLIPKIDNHGKKHFEINSELLFEEKSSKSLEIVADALIDIRNWLFHPEKEKTNIKIRNKICKKLNIINPIELYKNIWKIISCFLYKDELIKLLNELDQIYVGENDLIDIKKFLNLNFYSVSDSFFLIGDNLDEYSRLCQTTKNKIEENSFSLELKSKWNELINFKYQYSGFLFNYDYLENKLLIENNKSNFKLLITNLDYTNLSVLKISRFFYNNLSNIKEISFEDFQHLDSGFLTKKYKRFIKEIYKALKNNPQGFDAQKNKLIERLEKEHNWAKQKLLFLNKIDLKIIRNETFHFSYKNENLQTIYSEFLYLITHENNSSKNKIQKIEEDLMKKINIFLLQ